MDLKHIWIDLYNKKFLNIIPRHILHKEPLNELEKNRQSGKVPPEDDLTQVA